MAGRLGKVRPARLRWLTLPTLGALGVLAWKVTVNSPGLYLGGFTAIALGAAVLVVSVIDGEHRSARVLGSRPMTYLGEISYALYLVHVAVIYAVQQYVHVGAKWQMLLTVAISLPLAAVIDQVVERPIRRYRHRLDRPARTDVAAPVREPVLVRD